MTEDQARHEHLNFTGIYSFNKEEVKARITKERQERPKARIVLVKVPHSPLSRSGHGGCGYSAYADEKYSAYDIIKNRRSLIASHTSRVEKLKVDYEKALSEEITKNAKCMDDLVKAELLLQ